MDSWKCEACAKSFTGLVCFQQHEASEKHKKKIRQINGVTEEMTKPVLQDVGNQIRCAICLVSISGFDNFEKHVNSLEHAIMVQKKNNDFLSRSVSDTFELKSEPKQQVGSTTSMINPLNTTAPYAECKPCQKQFSGPEPYQQHLVSAGHKKKCGFSSNQRQMYEKGSSEENEKVAHDLSLINMASQPFAKCDVCQMQFFEAAYYQMHLVSDGHRNKVGNQLPGNAFFIGNQSAFKCDICSMAFTGPVPYQQHLSSIGHTKKVRAAEFSKTLATKTSLSPNSMSIDSNIIGEQSSGNNLQNWFCDICKKHCSGPIPYNSHIVSQDHLKNLRIQKMQENMRKIKESGPFPYIGVDEIDSNLSNEVTSTTYFNSEIKIEEMDDTPLEFKRNDLSVNTISDNTKILSNKFHLNSNDLFALPNLNIIPAEKLNVKVFDPDDEIIFSSNEK